MSVRMRGVPGARSWRRGCLAACLGLLPLILAGPIRAQGTTFGPVVESPIAGDPVTIDSGQIAGSLLPSGVKAYFGVPFAAAPVQQLRWREPQPVQPWHGVMHTDRFAPECIQALRAHDINHYFGEEATSEDCLYLNVWAPRDLTAASRKPVVVWIYGGGFTIGSANMANYAGESLARKGVVYVSVAYRVGALGFLAHPALSSESPHHSSGDLGFLDQIAALQWIHRNIERLGGDPANVTIMGQSAGSMSVSILQASPLARGLFQHVVGMSGAAIGNSSVGGARPLAAAEQDGLRLQESLHAADLAAMRNLPADRILQAQLAAPAHYGPVIDGFLLPSRPADIFAAGKQNDVPTLIGFTHDESFSKLAHARTLAEYHEYAHELYGDKAGALLKLYPAKDDAEARRAAVDAGRDSSVALQMRTWARAQAATGKSPVYVYLFSRVHPYAPGVTFSDHDPRTVGAYHTGDVPYWLGTLDSLNLFRTTRDWTDLDRSLGETMSNAIVAFASSGNPNRSGANDWPKYRADREQVREFGDVTRVIPWPNTSSMDFFVVNGAADNTDTLATAAHPVLEDKYPERHTAFAGGVVGIADLVYSVQPGFRPLRLDLYVPPGAPGSHPLVVFIHGGGWVSGHTRHSGAFEDWPGVLASLAAKGYVVASVEYRLSGEARFPAAIQDIKAAIRWLRAHASRFGIDRQRAVVWGGSAGGQLAALAATSCGAAALQPAPLPPAPGGPAAPRPEDTESDCVQGLIAWYGIFDFSTIAAQSGPDGPQRLGAAGSAPSQYLGCALSSCAPAVLAAASAASYVDPTDPPALLIHGVVDHTVPVQQSRDFYALLRSKGVSVELIEIPGVDHSFIGSTPEATRAASLLALQKSFEFIDRTVGPGSATKAVKH
jgi:para-nitrobenzyl esterase